MPVEQQKVEGFKLTPEHRAFQKVYGKYVATQQIIKRGLVIQMQKLQSLQKLAQEVEGKKRELLLRAPSQSVYDSTDEGMKEQSQQGATAQGGMDEQQLRDVGTAPGQPGGVS
jgi:hypothetical protein